MKKLNIILGIVCLICSLCVGCQKNDNERDNNTQNREQTETEETTESDETEATMENCEFLSEWDASLFEVFGFNYLCPPAKAYYPSIEKGRTYLIGEFSAKDFECFEEFFKIVYSVVYGQINDVKQVLDYNEGVYSFECEYAVPEIYKESIANSNTSSKRSEKYAWLKITYDESDRKCALECRLIKNLSINKGKKDTTEQLESSEG